MRPASVSPPFAPLQGLINQQKFTQLAIVRIEKIALPIRGAKSGQASRLQHAQDFPGSIHRPAEVLEQSMGKDGIETRIGKRQLINAGGTKFDGEPLFGRFDAGPLELIVNLIDRRDGSGRDTSSQAQGNRSRAAAAIQQGHPRLEVRREKGRVGFRRAPPHKRQDGRRVARGVSFRGHCGSLAKSRPSTSGTCRGAFRKILRNIVAMDRSFCLG